MPRASKQSRSLFVALPWDLKQRIRTQHSGDLDSLQVQQDATRLLPTQPAPDRDPQPEPPAKKRKRLTHKPANDPAWDCESLVPRYTHPSQVPKELIKCA